MGALLPGEYIAYCAFDQSLPKNEYPHSLFLVTSSGVPLGRLLEGVCNASLSPTGMYIATVDTKGRPLYGASLVVVNLLESTQRRIPMDEECDYPTWSPDERMVAVECADGNIHVIPIDAAQEIVIRCGERGIGPCRNPEWSPDGSYIAWNAGEPFGAPVRLHLTDTSCLSDASTCSEAEVVLGGLAGPYAWAPDAKRIAGQYRAEDGNTLIGLVNIHEDRNQPPTLVTVADPISLVWSPDGQHLAFTQDNPSFALDPLEIVSVSGGDPARVGVQQEDAMVQFWMRVED